MNGGFQFGPFQPSYQQVEAQTGGGGGSKRWRYRHKGKQYVFDTENEARAFVLKRNTVVKPYQIEVIKPLNPKPAELKTMNDADDEAILKSYNALLSEAAASLAAFRKKLH